MVPRGAEREVCLGLWPLKRQLGQRRQENPVQEEHKLRLRLKPLDLLGFLVKDRALAAGCLGFSLSLSLVEKIWVLMDFDPSLWSWYSLSPFFLELILLSALLGTVYGLQLTKPTLLY